MFLGFGNSYPKGDIDGTIAQVVGKEFVDGYKNLEDLKLHRLDPTLPRFADKSNIRSTG